MGGVVRGGRNFMCSWTECPSEKFAPTCAEPELLPAAGKALGRSDAQGIATPALDGTDRKTGTHRADSRHAREAVPMDQVEMVQITGVDPQYVIGTA